MTTTSTDPRTNATPTRVPVTGRRRWRTWPDWTNLALGAYLILAPLWTASAPVAWFLALGLLIVAAAVWALGTFSSPAAEWSQIVLGAVTFLSPWLGGFAGAAAAAWTAWIVGLAVIVLAAVAMSQAKRTFA